VWNTCTVFKKLPSNLLNEPQYVAARESHVVFPSAFYSTTPRSLNRAIKIKDTGHHERCAKADLVHCQPHGIADHDFWPVGSTLGHVAA
jgi:hypothetical protein